MDRLRTLLVYASSDANRTLSYQQGWPEHFKRHPAFACTSLNLHDRRAMARVAAGAKVLGRYDAMVLLHSVFSNQCEAPPRLVAALRRNGAPKAWFIGNEYKLMPEKMAFAEALDLDLLVSQCDSERVHALYRERLGCAVTWLPNTGLDPELFHPGPPLEQRPIDIGYRAYASPPYLGHDERERIAAAFAKGGSQRGLAMDISLEHRDRFDPPGYAEFLRRCKAQLGTEAGGDYFELNDATRHAVNAYLEEHPGAPFEEVFGRFFKDYRNNVPLRILSSRNVEAAGTKTVQVLMEGRYGGYLEPDVHYIPVKRDLSNPDEALSKLGDATLCERMAQRAYDLALREFCYETMLSRLKDRIEALP